MKDEQLAVTPTRWIRPLITLIAAAGVIAFVNARVVSTSQSYATTGHSISQKFRSVPSEIALADFCYRLRSVRGITGVSYRDFSATDHTALVTVFYDPAVTTVRQVRVFIQHANLLWQKPLRT